jgi:hypothetical protein
MDTQDKDSTKVIKEKRFIRIESRLTNTEYEQLLSIHKELFIDMSSLIRFSLLKESRKIVVNVRELLVVLDHLGTTIGDSGNAIAHVLRKGYLWNEDESSIGNWTTQVDDLLEQHIRIQEKLEKHMRQLISLMSD